MKYSLPMCTLLALLISPSATRAQPPAAKPAVLVDCEVVQLPLTKLRQLGVDLTTLGYDRKALTDVVHGRFPGYQAIDAERARLLLDKLGKENQLKVLMSPRLTVLDGETATVHIGGSTAHPANKEGGPPTEHAGAATPVSQLGTLLTVTPRVLNAQEVRLVILLRHDEPGLAQDMPAGNDGARVPPIQTTEMRTNLQLRSGETVVLAGQIESQSLAVSTGIPWLSEIPYVGASFRQVKWEPNRLQAFLLVRADIVPPGAKLPACNRLVKSLSEPQVLADDEPAAVQPVRYDAPPTIVPASADHFIRR